LSVTSATFTAEGSAVADASPATGACGSASANAARPGITGGAFADLVNNRGLVLMSLAVLLAIAFGAIHAMAPGHGKSITAAYLVGAGGRIRQAVIAGVAIASMHTASVIGLGLLILSAEKLFAPEKVYPWLGLVSGIVVLGLGSYLLATRARAIGWREGFKAAAPADHSHGEGHDPDHGHEHGHTHPELDPSQSLLSKKGLAVLAVSGGMLPSPTALVVLLASVAIHRVAFGLGLILAFSVGLAAALIGIGIAAIRARDVVSKRMGSGLGRLIPVGSAAVIILVGAFLVVRAAGQV
jgi:ABC-type nickel/cobalt efflux system permease component RcnA